MMLPAGFAISGTVTNPSGDAVPYSRIQILDRAGTLVSSEWAQANMSGEYMLGVPAGEYTIKAFSNCGGCNPPTATTYLGGVPGFAQAQFVTVSKENLTGNDIQLSTGATISGRVTKTVDNVVIPAVSVPVSIFDATGNTVRSGYTSRMGTYSLSGLGEGSYIVAFDSSNNGGYVTAYNGGATTSATATPIVIDGVTNATAVDASLTPFGSGGASTITATKFKVTGIPQVGQTLTAFGEGWSPSDATLTYTWNDYASMIGAMGAVLGTEESYTPTDSDLYRGIIVTVTANKAGFSEQIYRASASDTIQPAVAILQFTDTSPPTISGTAQVGSTLTASHATSTPQAPTTAFQWLRNETPIDGAKNATYVLTAADLSQKISVASSFQKTSYWPSTLVSAPTAAVTYATLTGPTPSISGDPAVGNTLTAITGDWGSDVNLSYQWRNAGSNIPTATNATYVTQASDVGKDITLVVTGAKTNFNPASKESSNAIMVTGEALTLTLTPTPTITGTMAVGSTLTATPGTWDTSVTLSFQWRRGGTDIPGAIGASYVTTASDVGSRMSLMATGTRPGYTSATIVSLETKAIEVVPATLPPAVSSTPSTNPNFVRLAYKDFLGRIATNSEVSYWSSQIASGAASQASLARTLSTSDEWIQVVIKGFYVDTLGREPDAAGYQYWIGQARSGKPLADIGAFFYGSDEYFNGFGNGSQPVWVGDLYQKLMLRGADSGGVNYWLGLLQSGSMNRTEVAKWFYQSPEKRRLRVDALYTKLLNRGSDAGGRAYWAGRLLAEGDLALASSLSSSPEYFGRQYLG
jgi:hypothetical protein